MPLLFILRDLMLPIVYIDAWCMDHFVWRGNEMTLSAEESSVEHRCVFSPWTGKRRDRETN
jgi:uncharacterized membrane protein